MKLSKASIKAIKAKAKQKGITEGEAADRLIATAAGRNAAVARYVPKPKRKPAKRKPARTAAKPRPKPKAARKPRVRKPKAARPLAAAPVAETSEIN